MLRSDSNNAAYGEDANLLVTNRDNVGSLKDRIRSFLVNNRVFSIWTLVNTVLVLVSWLLILILAARVNRNANGNITPNHGTIARSFVASTSTLPGFVPPQVGDVVSLNDDSQLVKGAGISIYQSLNEFHKAKPVKHLHSVTMPSKSTGTGVIVCYNDDTSAYLLYGHMNPLTNSIVWMNEGTSLKEHKLNQCDRFERINNDVIVIVAGKNLVPVTVTESYNGGDKRWSAKFTFGKTLQYMNGLTISPQLAILSPNSVALVYYHTMAKGTFIETLVAQMNGAGADCEFVVWDQIEFSENHMSMQVMAFSPTVYVICHPNATASDESGTSALACTPLSINTERKLVVGRSEYLDYVRMDYFFDMGLISANKGVVAFTDERIGNGIRAVVLELISHDDRTYSLDFGSTVIINTGHASGPLPSGLWTYINLEVLRENMFVVVYTDLSNDGRVSCIIAEMNEASTLMLTTPEFVVSLKNPNLNNYYWTDVSIVSPSMFFIVDSATGPDFPQGGASVTIGELKNGVLGVVHKKTSGNRYDVLVSGQAKVTVTERLVPGFTYYSSTKGQLIKGNAARHLSQGSESYITDGRTHISHSSVVGIAISNNEIHLA